MKLMDPGGLQGAVRDLTGRGRRVQSRTRQETPADHVGD